MPKPNYLIQIYTYGGVGRTGGGGCRGPRLVPGQLVGSRQLFGVLPRADFGQGAGEFVAAVGIVAFARSVAVAVAAVVAAVVVVVVAVAAVAVACSRCEQNHITHQSNPRTPISQVYT